MMDWTTMGITGVNWLWLMPLVVWTAIWEGLGLWRAARRKEIVWFILMLVLNTAGVLPIIYVIIARKKKGKKRG